MASLTRAFSRERRRCSAGSFALFWVGLFVVASFTGIHAFPSSGLQQRLCLSHGEKQQRFRTTTTVSLEDRDQHRWCSTSGTTRAFAGFHRRPWKSLPRLYRLGRSPLSKKLLLVSLLVGALFVFASPLAAHASTAAVEPTTMAEVATTAVTMTDASASASAAIMRTTMATVAARPVALLLELQLTFRLIYAAVIGAMLGKERSLAKHSAGVRTMALVAMGASAFTVCSAFGFMQFPGRYDPSRMAASVASGVGFVGAGVITTSSAQQQQQQQQQTGGKSSQQAPANVVHGLTTAATIWLSAAVGVACGVGLYAVATTACLATISILRLGRIKPKAHGVGKSSQKPTASKVMLDPPHERVVDDNEEEHNAEHPAETHDTSVWDEHPHFGGSSKSDDEDVPEQDHVVQPVVQPPLSKSARKPYVSKNPRRKGDPVIRIVKNAWDGSNTNSTSGGVFFAYDDMQEMNLDDLEKFLKRQRSSSSSSWYLSDRKNKDSDDRLGP